MLTETHEQVKLTPLENTEFIIEPGLLTRTGLLVIAGEPGVGKSWLAMQAGFDISKGRRLWGIFPTRKARVIHFELENRTPKERERFISFENGYSSDIGYCDKIQPTLDNHQFNAFYNEIKDWGAEVCIIDSFQATIDDENDSKTQKKTLKWYRDTANKLQVSIILVQQIKKRQKVYDGKSRKFLMPPLALDDIRGSKVFEYGIDTAIGLSRDSHTDKYIQFLKTRYSEYSLYDIKIELKFESKLHLPKYPILSEILNILDNQGNCGFAFIENCLKISRPTLINCVEQLTSLGLVKTNNMPGSSKILEPINIPTNHQISLLDFNPVE